MTILFSNFCCPLFKLEVINSTLFLHIYFFSFDPNFIIFGYSLFFFIQNIIITIITRNIQFVKRHFLFHINIFIWSLCYFSCHWFRSTQLSVFHHICLQLNISINRIIIRSVFLAINPFKRFLILYLISFISFWFFWF